MQSSCCCLDEEDLQKCLLLLLPWCIITTVHLVARAANVLVELLAAHKSLIDVNSLTDPI